jgi:hypothetical protein
MTHARGVLKRRGCIHIDKAEDPYEPGRQGAQWLEDVLSPSHMLVNMEPP